MLFAFLLLSAKTSNIYSQINYDFTASSGSFIANTSPTNVFTSGDDVLSSAINIGFTFNYGGCTTSPYTQFKVSSNGWMGLGTGATGSQSSNDLSWNSYGPIIAPLWDDLNIASGGSINYKLTGAAGNRVLTVEWKNMKWYWAASSAGISFQVKLYESDGKIEFIYQQESGSLSSASASIGLHGFSSSDYYSLNGTGTSPTANYGSQTSNLNSKPATGQIYTWSLPATMTYVSSNVFQASTADVYQSTGNNEILGIEINVLGGCSPLSITELVMNMNGTTAISDVTNIDVYYTGNTSIFSASTLFGSAAPSLGNITISGSQSLINGSNYFWIVYDVSATAIIGDFLDAECTQVTINGGVGNQIPTGNPPAGSRPIVVQPPSFSKWIELGWAKEVLETSDGNLLWVGRTNNTYSSGGSDLYLIKTNKNLSTIYWSTVSGTATSDETIEDVVETADGFVAVGWSNMAGGASGYNILVTKVNTSGTVQWTRTIGTSSTDYGYGITNLSDGNIAICGTDGGSSNGYFAKINNSDGSIMAEKSISATGVTYLYCITETSDGGVLMGGRTNNDFYLIKLTNTFSVDWAGSWGGVNNDYIYFVIENTLNDYTVGGYSYSYGSGDNDGYVMRFTKSGAGAPTIAWNKTYGTTGGNSFNDGEKTSDGGYIMTGITDRLGDPLDDETLVTKINSSGDIEFTKSIGTISASEDQEGYGICQTSEGHYAVAGLHNSAIGANFYMVYLAGDGYNCATIQDNGAATDQTPPSFSSTGSVSLPFGFTTVLTSPIINTGGVITSDGCISVLSLDDLKFDGENKGSYNILSWIANDVTYDYYILEKSTNGALWEEVSKVDVNDNGTSFNKYQVLDNNLSIGITYYRLHVFNKNGEEGYSKIVALNFENNKTSSIGIYPNPFNSDITLLFSEKINQPINITVSDVCGKIILKESTNPRGESAMLYLGNYNLAKGVYLINIYGDSISESIKIIKE